MSINADAMKSKNVVSTRKTKSILKRRKKTSSLSDLSYGSLSPSKRQFQSNISENEPLSPGNSSNNSSFPSPGAFKNYFRYSSNSPQSQQQKQQQNGVQSEYVFGTETTMMMTTTTTTTKTTTPIKSTNQGIQSFDGKINRPFDYVNGFVPQQNESIRSDSDADNNISKNDDERQPRTTEDFYLFCKLILEYENYNEAANQEALRNSTHSPMDSTGSATESTTSSALNEESNQVISNNIESVENDRKNVNELPNEMIVSGILDESTINTSDNMVAINVSTTNDDVTDESDIDADSYNLITCYCGKPYAARPMIECSQCLTWLHLSCAKIKRKHIPDIFICVKCAKNGHSKDHETSFGRNEPKENNRLKRSSYGSSQQRTDKIENNILQPLNGATYETSTKSVENVRSSTASSVAFKYK